MSASPAYGGKCRALRGDRGMLAYTGQNINTRILCQILTAPVGRVWRFTHFYSVAPLLEKWFTCHHFVQEWQARYLLPLCKNRIFVSAYTCPFRRLRRHLSQGKASHTLLQRRFAPRKAVRLLPVIRGRLKTCMLSFSFHKAGNAFCMIHFVIFRFCSYLFISFFLHVKRPPPWFGEVFFYFFYFLPMCLAL